MRTQMRLHLAEFPIARPGIGAIRSWATIGLILASASVSAQRVETEPTLRTRDLLRTGVSLRGDHYELSTTTAVQGYLGQFRIRTHFGDIDAQGSEILVERISEMSALARIDDISRSSVFAGAIAA